MFAFEIRSSHEEVFFKKNQNCSTDNETVILIKFINVQSARTHALSLGGH